VRILTLTHGADVGPELFADVAAEAGHELQRWDMERDGAPPRAAEAVAVFGGHQNVGEEQQYPWLEDEYEALRGWVEAGTPVFAVCLGAQTLAHALDARVERMPDQLAGWYRTELTDDGAADPVLGVLPREFECFNGNAYSFALPPDAQLLADGPCLQAYRVHERAWAVQFHPELKRPTFRQWFPERPLPGADEKLSEWRPLGARLFRAFFAAASEA
jgi:GMP synthase (glutamine-hydrolysing)